MGERTPDQPLTVEELEKLLLWANPTEKAAIRASHELLRRRLTDAEKALHDIAESSPNWMEGDAVAKSERRKSEIARESLAAARDRQPPQTTEGTES